jgi:fructose-1,6-bisphosphatase II
MAAIASAKLMGRGNKNESDQAAVDAMRKDSGSARVRKNV